jgi:hypothetical protein
MSRPALATEPTAQQLASSYEQTFARVDCSKMAMSPMPPPP